MTKLRAVVLAGLWVAFTGAAYAARMGQVALSGSANEQACTLGPRASTFQATEGQIFLRFLASGLRTGDRLQVDWIAPDGSIAQSTPYEDLPPAPSHCLLTALPVAGFAAAETPGRWSVRVLINNAALAALPFEISGRGVASGLRLLSIQREPAGTGTEDLVIEASGITGETTVNVARYTPEGGWRYFETLLASSNDSRHLRVRHPALAVGEYMVVLRNPDGGLSFPRRLAIESGSGYKLPFTPGAPWILTQGPYGGFSHFNRSRHAYDIAPGSNRCVVAMRGGVVHAFDRRQGRTPKIRSFGNYITIAHDGGEFSHYAHLRTGTFLVRTGQRVDAGHALAMAGNSGYALGAGGGHHVHVHVTKSFSISSQSVPFRFEDLPRTARSGAIYSRNANPQCDCTKTALAKSSPKGRRLAQWTHSVWPTQSWSSTVDVPSGATALNVNLEWTGAGKLALYAVSPSGRQYESEKKDSEAAEGVDVPSPEPGPWRVAVLGLEGGSEAIGFTLDSAVTEPEPGSARQAAGSRSQVFRKNFRSR